MNSKKNIVDRIFNGIITAIDANNIDKVTTFLGMVLMNIFVKARSLRSLRDDQLDPIVVFDEAELVKNILKHGDFSMIEEYNTRTMPHMPTTTRVIGTAHRHEHNVVDFLLAFDVGTIVLMAKEIILVSFTRDFLHLLQEVTDSGIEEALKQYRRQEPVNFQKMSMAFLAVFCHETGMGVTALWNINIMVNLTKYFVCFVEACSSRAR